MGEGRYVGVKLSYDVVNFLASLCLENAFFSYLKILDDFLFKIRHPCFRRPIISEASHLLEAIAVDVSPLQKVQTVVKPARRRSIISW